MKFAFDEDTLLFQTTLRDFLAKEVTPESIRASWERERGHDPVLWKQLAELGVLGLLVPETHEGMGLDETTLVLLMEEVGRAALAEPLISTAAVAAPLLADGGGELAERWLKRIAVGEAVVAVAHAPDALVADAEAADLLLLPAGEALHALEPAQVRITPQPSNDPSRRLATVAFDASAESRIADGERAAALCAAALDRGALAAAAQALGAADQLLAMSVQYASERKQFGVPIGSFQAVKHHLANVKVALEYARPVVYRAAASVATEHPQRSLHVSMAKLRACDAATAVARTALQVHGAIGYTWEQDLHLWMRRAWSLDLAWGTRAGHQVRAAAAVLDGDVPLGPGTTFTRAGDA